MTKERSGSNTIESLVLCIFTYISLHGLMLSSFSYKLKEL